MMVTLTPYYHTIKLDEGPTAGYRRGINDLSILAQFNNRCWSVSLARRLTGNPVHLPSSPFPCLSFVSHKRSNLQGVGQELVHLRDLGRDREVDGPVSDLDNQAADDVRVDLFASAYGRFPGVRLVLFPTSLVTLSFLPWPT